MGIFPSLVNQAALHALLVLYKSILIDVAVFFDPSNGPFYVGPYLHDSLAVGGPPVIVAGQRNKQRCSVDRAVVLAEGNFIECGHLAFACLMKYFSRFRVA